MSTATAFLGGWRPLPQSRDTQEPGRRGGEHPSILGQRNGGFIALPETGWRQKSGASLGALSAKPWGC